MIDLFQRNTRIRKRWEHSLLLLLLLLDCEMMTLLSSSLTTTTTTDVSIVDDNSSSSSGGGIHGRSRRMGYRSTIEPMMTIALAWKKRFPFFSFGSF
jgi:hypothetical protein